MSRDRYVEESLFYDPEEHKCDKTWEEEYITNKTRLTSAVEAVSQARCSTIFSSSWRHLTDLTICFIGHSHIVSIESETEWNQSSYVLQAGL